MNKFDATWALLDSDQGVCPDGHQCELVTQSGVRHPMRSCSQPHPDLATGRETGTVTYVGMPLGRADLSLADIAGAAYDGVHIDLINWLRSEIADREAPDTNASDLADGAVDVEIVPAGPGAYRFPVSAEPDWDAADVSLTVGNIADGERASVAEIGLLATHIGRGQPVDVSIELTVEDIDHLIAALKAIKASV